MAFEQLPNDSFMLLSVVNTKLRDTYGSLQALCEDLNVDQEEFEERLRAIDYTYQPEANRFV